jgi:hypothetical protein
VPVRHDSNLHYTIHVILSHPSDPRVLMLPQGEAWVLPNFVSDGHANEYVGHISTEMSR